MLISIIYSCRLVDGEREFRSVYPKDRHALDLPLISRLGYYILPQIAIQVLIGADRTFLKPWDHRSHLYQNKTSHLWEEFKSINKKKVVLEHFVSRRFLHQETHLNPFRLSRDCHLILSLFYKTTGFPKVPWRINGEACARTQIPWHQSVGSSILQGRSLFALVITGKVGVEDRKSQRHHFQLECECLPSA